MTDRPALAPTVADTARLLDLKRRIEKLSLGDQMRVVAACIDDGNFDLAETLASNVIDLLRARRLFWRQPSQDEAP